MATISGVVVLIVYTFVTYRLWKEAQKQVAMMARPVLFVSTRKAKSMNKGINLAGA